MNDKWHDTANFTFGEPDEVLGYAVVGRDENHNGFDRHVADDEVHRLWSDGNGVSATGNAHACWGFYHTVN